MIRITLNRNKCIGCGACAEASYSRWRMSRKDGKSVLINGLKKKEIYSVVTGDDEYAENLRAARNCPVKIIEVKKI
jgi:ferredoxin